MKNTRQLDIVTQKATTDEQEKLGILFLKITLSQESILLLSLNKTCEGRWKVKRIDCRDHTALGGEASQGNRRSQRLSSTLERRTMGAGRTLELDVRAQGRWRLCSQ